MQTQPEKYLSQSEVGDWTSCPLAAHARWILDLRPPDVESRPQRIGSMGHAIFADRIIAACEDRDPQPEVAVDREAVKRKWAGDLADETDLATAAVDLLSESGLVTMDPARIVPSPDTYDGRRPLVEERLKVAWSRVLPSLAPRLAADVRACSAIMQRFAGIEGQVDLVSAGDDWSFVITDLKFRQSSDLGGAASDEESRLPDRQFAWYSVLLYSAGLRPRAGFECHQVNVFAGRWITAEDFLAAAERPHLVAPEVAALILKDGMPTMDQKRIGKVGAVTAPVWAEVHRILAECRYHRKVAEWSGRGKRPEVLTPTEQTDARRFLADLEAQRFVVARKFRADLDVCAEVARDMIVSVEAPLSLALRGVTPPRILKTYPKSPCVRPYGCAYQGPCHASLGSGRVLAALAEQAAQAAREDAPDAPLPPTARLLILGQSGIPASLHVQRDSDCSGMPECDCDSCSDARAKLTRWPQPTHDDAIGVDDFGGSDDV